MSSYLVCHGFDFGNGGRRRCVSVFPSQEKLGDGLPRLLVRNNLPTQRPRAPLTLGSTVLSSERAGDRSRRERELRGG